MTIRKQIDDMNFAVTGKLRQALNLIADEIDKLKGSKTPVAPNNPKWYQRKSILNDVAYIRADSFDESNRVFNVTSFKEDMKFYLSGIITQKDMDKYYTPCDDPTKQPTAAEDEINKKRITELEKQLADFKELVKDWNDAAEKGRQPLKFYEGYDEGVMRAMQALMVKAESKLAAAEADAKTARDIEHLVKTIEINGLGQVQYHESTLTWCARLGDFCAWKKADSFIHALHIAARMERKYLYPTRKQAEGA